MEEVVRFQIYPLLERIAVAQEEIVNLNKESLRLRREFKDLYEEDMKNESA